MIGAARAERVETESKGHRFYGFVGKFPFTAPASDGGSPIEGYQVECVAWNTSCPKQFYEPIFARGLLVEIGGLTEAEFYEFRVRARKRQGYGPWSDYTNAIVAGIPPEAPLGLSATPGDGGLTVSFNQTSRRHSPPRPTTSKRSMKRPDAAKRQKEAKARSRCQIWWTGIPTRSPWRRATLWWNTNRQSVRPARFTTWSQVNFRGRPPSITPKREMVIQVRRRCTSKRRPISVPPATTPTKYPPVKSRTTTNANSPWCRPGPDAWSARRDRAEPDQRGRVQARSHRRERARLRALVDTVEHRHPG